MIEAELKHAHDIHWQRNSVDKHARRRLNGHGSAVVWFTGLSGAGKSTVAGLLEQRLYADGVRTYLLDGDNVRHGLSRDLGFRAEDRAENIRRVAEVAKLMLDAGLVVITALISPFRADRSLARHLVEPHEFVEVYMKTPLEVAEQRDPKGLYNKARSGGIKNFTGIDSAYEAPETAEVVIEGAVCDPLSATGLIYSRLGLMGVVPVST